MKRQAISSRNIACLLAVLCALIVSTANADSLRNQIINQLKHGLEITETNDNSDSSSSVDVSISDGSNSVETTDLSLSPSGAELIQIKSSPVDSGLIQVDSSSTSPDDAGLIQIDSSSTSGSAELIQTHAESHSQIKFDCWERNKTTCATQNCVWVGNVCTISPAAFVAQCKFYCFSTTCIVPLTGKNDPETPCVPKLSTYEGLCSAVKTEELCNLQGGLCRWMDRKGCIEAPSCCSKARKYCERRDSDFLSPALKACDKFTTKAEICTFSSNNCEMAPVYGF